MQLQDTVIQVILLIAFLVATPLYLRRFWKSRIPHTPDRWGFPIGFLFLIWIATGHSAMQLFADSWFDKIPPFLKSLIIPAGIILSHLCVWRICLGLKRRQEKAALKK